jgi:hypothetical protein
VIAVRVLATTRAAAGRGVPAGTRAMGVAR